MQRKLLFSALGLIGALFFVSSSYAQTGTFTIKNYTGSTYSAKAGSSDNTCSVYGASAVVSLPPGVTVIPDSGQPGIWQAFKVKDGTCGFTGVENGPGCFGYGTTISSFTDCNGNTVTLQILTANTGIVF